MGRLNILVEEITMNQVLFNNSANPAWSGIRTVDASNACEALAQAGMDWEVKSEKIFLDNGMEIKSSRAIVRQSDRSVLGVVGKKYAPIQNTESLSFFDDVATQFEDFQYISAGSINNGKRVWLLADFGGFDAQHGDEVRKQILLYNSHDGTSAMSYVFVPMRVFCNNQIASIMKGDKFMKIRHSQSAHQRIEAAKQVAGHALENYTSIEAVYKRMARMELTNSMVTSTLELMYPLEGVEGRSLTRRENTRQEILRLLDEGMGIHERPKNALSLFNAFSEYYTHHTQTNGENARERRWNNNVFGKGAKAMAQVTEHIVHSPYSSMY